MDNLQNINPAEIIAHTVYKCENELYVTYNVDVTMAAMLTAMSTLTIVCVNMFVIHFHELPAKQNFCMFNFVNAC